MYTKETILFAPLNWGLGHATRIVPLIKAELAKNNKVIITANGNSYQFLRNEFPDLTFIETPEFRIRYAPQPFFNIVLLVQMPFFFFSFYRDNLILKGLISAHGITKVVSDNRYGFYNKNIKSVLITHQLFIKLPNLLKWFEPLLHFATKRLIEKFNECWVPDYEKFSDSLSGALSHGKTLPKNVKYIDPLSRFSTIVETLMDKPKYDVVALISGPEPQRTIFEEELKLHFRNFNGKVLFILGKPHQYNSKTEGSITFISHTNDDEIAYYLKNAGTIIARSGYSTIMDLHALNLKARWVPTPGQTEQEYLADWNKIQL